jgi:ferrochelatase
LAKANYALMGGGSPILPETIKQADALEAAIRNRVGNVTFKCFPAMRYWKPFVKDVAKSVKAWGATDAILLPLYPQFSSTTTASSLKEWRRHSASALLHHLLLSRRKRICSNTRGRDPENMA